MLVRVDPAWSTGLALLWAVLALRAHPTRYYTVRCQRRKVHAEALAARHDHTRRAHDPTWHFDCYGRLSRSGRAQAPWAGRSGFAQRRRLLTDDARVVPGGGTKTYWWACRALCPRYSVRLGTAQLRGLLLGAGPSDSSQSTTASCRNQIQIRNHFRSGWRPQAGSVVS